MSTSHPESDAQAPLSPHLQPLSRSSSSLLGEGCGQRPELHKRASSTVWQAWPREAGPQVLQEDGRQAESTEEARAPSLQPWPGAAGPWRGSPVDSVSPMGSGELSRLQVLGATTVHKSHSDLVRSPQTRGHSGARKSSLSCSALGSSPARRAPLWPGSTVGLEGDLTPEDGVASRAVETSKSAWTLGASQAWVPPLGLGDTTATSSSPQPGPKAAGQLVATSSQALPPAVLLCGTRKVGVSCCCHALPATGILTFPKLVASVSESGLQAQHGMKFHCRLPRELAGHAHCCAHPWGPAGLATEPSTGTKDVWTMTSASDLGPMLATPLSAQDAGVQVAPVAACKAVATSPPLEAPLAPHVFPEVTLGASLEETTPPVRDVRWDAEGMTWEVYGASVDPEVLGVAIQKHLEMQFEQLQREPASEDSLSAEGRRRPLRAVMQSLRRPSCCGCSGAAPE